MPRKLGARAVTGQDYPHDRTGGPPESPSMDGDPRRLTVDILLGIQRHVHAHDAAQRATTSARGR